MKSYAIEMREASDRADGTLLGVKLGRLCIRTKTPVSFVATHCAVSKAAVYNWFVGRYSPTPQNRAAVIKLISDLKDIQAINKST